MSRRGCGPATSLIAALLLANAPLARADPLQGHASATASFGYTAIQADDGTTGGTGPLFAFTPAIGATHVTQRVEQSLDYSFTLNVQFNPDFSTSSDLITYANRAVYGNHVYVAPTVDFLSSVSVTEAPVNTVAIGAAPSAATITPSQSTGTNLQGVAAAGFVEALNERTRLTESGSFTVGLPIDVTPSLARTYAGVLAVGLDRSITERDDANVTVSGMLAHFTAGHDAFTGVKAPPFDQTLDTLVGSWRHDFTPDLAATASAGGLVSYVPETSGSLFGQPVGALVVDYARPTYALELAYQHAAALDLYLADIQLVDEVTLRGIVPLALDRDIVGSATAGYSHSRAIARDGSLVNPFDLWAIDVGAAWTPHTRPELAIGARLNVARQSTFGSVAPAAAAAAGTVASFTRESVLLSITYGYPSAATPAPAYISPAFRAAPITTGDLDAAIKRYDPLHDTAEPEAPPAAPAP